MAAIWSINFIPFHWIISGLLTDLCDFISVPCVLFSTHNHVMLLVTLVLQYDHVVSTLTQCLPTVCHPAPHNAPQKALNDVVPLTASLRSQAIHSAIYSFWKVLSLQSCVVHSFPSWNVILSGTICWMNEGVNVVNKAAILTQARPCRLLIPMM